MKFVRQLRLITLLKLVAIIGSFGTSVFATESPEGRYIAVLKETVESSARTVAQNAGLRDRIGHTFDHGRKGFVFDGDGALAEMIERHPMIAWVEPDVRIEGGSVPWGLDRINQIDLPLDGNGFAGSGAGVDIYIMDSGVSPLPEFGSRIVGAVSFRAGESTADCNGHGTAVASVAAGSTYGVARAASIWNLRVLGCDGSGWVSDWIVALDWIRARHQNNPGLRGVVNMSLLSNSPSVALDEKIRDVVQAGVVAVVCGGNSPVDACSNSPSRTGHPSYIPNNMSGFSAISVGWTDQTDAKNPSSSFGGCIDLFAPGTAIPALDQYGTEWPWYGCSFAVPHVAGIAAVFWNNDPSANPSMMEGYIKSRAIDERLTNIGAGSPNSLLCSIWRVRAVSRR